jgi:oligopeptide transport system substrate-binding protein
MLKHVQHSRIFAGAKILFFYLLFFPLSVFSAGPFRLHLSTEPINLDPHQQKSSSSSYLLQNLYRNLFTYEDDKGLVPDLAESCKRESPMVLVCKLKKNLKWSDGSYLVSDDFLRAYQRILNAKEASPRADLLFKIKNAPAIYKGQKKIESLGITVSDSRTLRFEFEERDPDFEYNLASFLLAPVKNTLQPGQKASELIVSGPYHISEWIKGQKIILTNNTHYKFGSGEKRPDVEILFINEDSMALQLYEKNELSFLRRLPTLYIPKFKKRSDFYWIPVVRLDYIGFGPQLKDHPKVREALAHSLDYKELQKIFSAEGMPGCPGISRSWMNEELCYSFDATKAKKVLAEDKNIPPNMQLMYSSLGGEDHRRATEWMQSQWQKNLGIKIQILLRENKVFIEELQQHPPALFRKGVAPDRPTCLATLETFADWSPENYIQIKDPEYQTILKNLGDAVQSKDQKKWCTQGIHFLMDRFLMIPTGPMHFAILAKSGFKGWRLNSMNQLDLANLEVKN